LAVPLISQMNGNHIISAPLILSQSTNLNAAFGTTLTLSGNISGVGGLATNDIGTVVLSGANTFTGATTINSGTLEISGSGSVASSSSIVEKNGATLRVGGGAVVVAPPVTLDLAGATPIGVNGNGSGIGNFAIEVVPGSTATLTGLLSNASGSLVKRGGGTLKIANSGNNVLSNVGNLSTVIQEGSAILDGGASATYAVTGGELAIGDNTPNEVSLTLTSGTLNVGTFTSVGRGNGTTGLQSSLNVTGGTLNTLNLFTGFANGVGGYSARPTINISGSGVVNATGTAGVRLGESAGAMSSLSLSDSATLSSLGDFQIGYGGQAIVSVAGNSTLNLALLSLGSGNNTVGNTGAAVIRQTGGTVQQAGAFGGDWRIGGYNGVNDSQSYGSYTLAGGTFNSGGRNIQIGANGIGVFDVSGGAYTSTGGFPVIGRFATGFGLVNISAGSFSQNGAGNLLIIGEAGNGVVNISGTGSLNVAAGVGAAGIGGGTGGIRLGHAATGVGALNLNGGTVTTTGIAKTNATGIASLYLNGGTLKAGVANITFLQGLDNAIVGPGGAIFDTNGNDITVGQALNAPTGQGVSAIPVTVGGSGYLGRPIVQITGGGGTGATAVANLTGDVVTNVTITNPGTGYTSAPTVALIGGGTTNVASIDSGTILLATSAADGGIKKRGAGVLTLAGNNGYKGATAIEAGTLLLTGSISGSANIAVMAGASFDVTNAPGGFSLANGQTLRGSGNVLGNVMLAAGSKLSPGDAVGTLALNLGLDLTGAVTATGSHSLVFELATPAASDRVTLTSGSLNIGTGVLAFNDFEFSSIGALPAGVYTLFDTSSAIVGSLDSNPANLTGAVGSFNATLGFSDGGRDLVLTVVPEPASAALLLAGAGVLLGGHRRRTRCC
jgi:autotransporter-associated beta strand protein